ACELPENAGFRSLQRFDYFFEALLELAQTMSAENEGFVVRFSDGTRVKIKGAEYCRIHRIVSNITPLGIWNSMLEMDDLDEIRNKIPEEFVTDFDLIVTILKQQFDAAVRTVADAVLFAQHMTDKELGMYINGADCHFPETAIRYIFPARKTDFFNLVNQPGLLRKRFFNTFRPTGNVLDGYEPTSVMNRFEEDG
ncbi:2'-5' RNA ligase, partial [candidate division KSB1 bacterium]|nr:2'-5' RNA ligase [candidate division KSB1 bacterium]